MITKKEMVGIITTEAIASELKNMPPTNPNPGDTWGAYVFHEDNYWKLRKSDDVDRKRVPNCESSDPESCTCVECGENTPEQGVVCEECRETRLYD